MQFTIDNDTRWATLLIEGYYTQVPAAPGNECITHVVNFDGRWVGFGTEMRAAQAAIEVADFHPVHYVDIDTNEVLYDGCAIDIVQDIP